MKAKVILLLLLGAVAASAAFLLLRHGNASAPVARITRDGAVLEEIALDKVDAPYSLTFEDESGRNVVTVERDRGRVFLGAVFSGQPMTLIYSAAGGLLSWCALCLLRKALTREHIWLASPAVAVFHNFGQLLAAAAVLRSWSVLAWLPYLVIAAVLAGLFTGVAAQTLIRRLDRIRK